MNYLKYIEYAPENLQFYLWLRDYTARFAQLSRSEAVLSPEWTQAQAAAEALTQMSTNKPSKKIDPTVAEVFKGTAFAADGKPKGFDNTDPFATPAKTPSLDDEHYVPSDYGSSTGDHTMHSNTTHRSVADQAFEDAGVKLKPCKFASVNQRMSLSLTTQQSPHSHIVTRSPA